MLAYIRRYQRSISIFLLFTMLNTLGIGNAAYALTSGPSAPESQQFAPAGMDNMVDPFTGDFSYNVPLMDVGGYPLNINYSAGITPDQEASWVGLGWNLNVGAINRSVRGLPDDFAGDQMTSQHHMKPNQTFGLTFAPPSGAQKELFTFKLSLAQNYNIFYNTYHGYGFSLSYTPSLDIPLMKGRSDSQYKLGLNLQASISLSSEDGVGITPSVGLKTKSQKEKDESSLSARVGFPYSSREGAKGMSLSTSFNCANNSKYSNPIDHTFSSFKGFSMPTYTPTIENDVFSINGALNIAPEKLQSVAPPDKTQFLLGGYYNGQFAKTTEDINPSYGYMYEGITADPNAVLDFNREKDGGYNENTTNMPVTTHTYDIFNVQGEGVGGAYRVFRSDVGVVGENIHTDETISPDLGISGGFNAKDKVTFRDLKLGIDFKYIQSEAAGSRWVNGTLQQQANPGNELNSIKENLFFGKIGDPAPENNGDYYDNTLLGTNVYEYHLNNGYTTGEYEYATGATSFFNKNSNANYLRDKRKNRNTSFSYLTASKADKFAIAPINNFTANDFSLDNSVTVERKDQQVNYNKAIIPRVGGNKKGHHISEVRVVNNSGSRYVYGVPVYNNVTHEVTFSVDVASNQNPDLNTIRNSGLVKYGDDDATIENDNGLEHYYQRTITPAHASAYLLNYVLSSDYVDSDGVPGPSDGDLGTYVKYNYSRTSDNYQWRTPYQAGMANFADGLADNRDDDKGSFTYGNKELWYLHSIETRTHVAEFLLDYRKDGLGVKDEKGGLDNPLFAQIPNANKLMCIKEISLYSKADKLNGKQEPLKTVHFEYDYSLCPKTPNSLSGPLLNNQLQPIANSENGKLTLKKVWFTYGFSNKGVLNPYTFEYADTDFDGSMDVNPAYNSKEYDRWGFYKQQTGLMGNEAFPYTLQDKSLTDKYAAAYSMTKITTPTGGEMRVHYESDDYGYVQNQKAMRMYTLKGVSNSSNGTVVNSMYDGPTSNLDGRLYLYINLKEGFKAADQASALIYFKNNYLGDLQELQYRVKLDVLNNKTENVSGYCRMNTDDINVISETINNETVYTTGVVKLEAESLNKGTSDIHPFTKNGWLYAALHYNREMMGSMDAGDNGFLQIVGSIFSSITSVLEFIFGFKLYMKTAGNSKHLTVDESFVRLYEHDKIKLGGGHRVKAIVMLDRWDDMKSDREKNSSGAPLKEQAGYGQVYDYTMPEDNTNPASRMISSGVAAYEPIIGGEENPIRKLVKTIDRVPMAPDKEYYSETPYGESYFPSPTVGYRKVKTTPVKVLINNSGNYDVAALQSNGTGYVEQEFYTAYDFPTFVSQTGLDPYREKTSQLNPLKIKSSDFVSCSQGYLVELNDMHGKAKSTKVMPDAASGSTTPISYVSYFYQVQSGNPSRLDNHVPLVNSNLDVSTQNNTEIATTVDVVNDTRYFKNVTCGGGADINIKFSMVQSFPTPPVFIPIISLFPDVNYERVIFNSITTTKVVNRYGVLVKTLAQDNGQTITTENLAWDKETGDVLLTKVQNEFHDPIYNFTYPGHWAYQAMALSYQNEGFEFNDLSAASVTNQLIDGDEVICTYAPEGVSVNGFVYYDKIQNKLLKKDGSAISALTWAQVVRSGGRNVAATPVATVSTLTNPIAGNKVNFAGTKVLNAGAAEFKHLWKGFCNCGEQSTTPNNPFITGQRGQLRPWRNWTYLTERAQNIKSGEVDIRHDGYFSDYKDFWNLGLVYLNPYYNLAGTANYKWQFVTEIENYNPIGMEIENKDALGRFSMAQFGYGRSLPIATSNNSRYQESGFDGFEDYDYGDCNDDHFSWRIRQNDANQGLDTRESHTGKKSFKVPAGSKSKIVKIIDPCDGQ